MGTTIDGTFKELTPTTVGGIRIQKVSERAPHFNLMVYGKSGVGKTKLAGSAYEVPEMRRVLYIDIEGGILTLRKWYPDIDTVRVQTWFDMQRVYDQLYAGGHGFQTVILDSLTEIQKFNMDEIMRQLVDKNDERDLDVPSLREWGKNLEQTRRFVRAFRDLPLNVIFTALVREDKDRMQRPVNLPSLSGKMAGEVAAFLDIVLYYRVAEATIDGETKNVRVLQSEATESTTAKDRSGMLPSVMVDPSMNQLYDLIVRKTGAMIGTQQEPKKEKPEAVETKREKAPDGVTDADLAALTAN